MFGSTSLVLPPLLDVSKHDTRVVEATLRANFGTGATKTNKNLLRTLGRVVDESEAQINTDELLDSPRGHTPYTSTKSVVFHIAMNPYMRLHMQLLKWASFAALLAIIAVVIRFMV
ncbi:hypothetical protein BBJ28_00018778 [Nothophytophthora sp. Chile5]|nr:hypothetical protein BBJ28_00018778 [Nothophytophthora sp. Chile5]